MKHLGVIVLILSIASLAACRDERGDPQVVLNEDKPVAIQPPADVKANEEGLPVDGSLTQGLGEDPKSITMKTNAGFGNFKKKIHTFLDFSAKTLEKEEEFYGESVESSFVEKQKYCLSQGQVDELKSKFSEYKLCAYKSPKKEDGSCPQTEAWLIMDFPSISMALGSQTECKNYYDMCNRSEILDYLKSKLEELAGSEC